MSQSQRNFLMLLRSSGPAGVPASQVPTGCRGLIDALQTCGAVRSRRSGRGAVLHVENSVAFESFVTARFPLGLDPRLGDVGDRTSGVRLLADAKAARRGRFEGIFVRSASPDAVLASDRGVLRVGELTAIAGGAAVRLGEGGRWSFRGTIAVVENAEAFWRHECVLPEVDLAVYSSGRLSERVIEWLASEGMSGCPVVHWGDYDPVGCLEYLRLRAKCGDRTRMHLPGAVAEMLPTHGKPALVLEQARELDALRAAAHDEAITKLIGLFDAHRKGLEQEALLIGVPTDSVSLNRKPA